MSNVCLCAFDNIHFWDTEKKNGTQAKKGVEYQEKETFDAVLGP